jgi:hypothetical protein
VSNRRALPFIFGFLASFGAAVLLAADDPLWPAVAGGGLAWSFYEVTRLRPRFGEL